MRVGKLDIHFSTRWSRIYRLERNTFFFVWSLLLGPLMVAWRKRGVDL